MTDPGSGSRTKLIDPLSDRELDVLHLLGSDLDGPAIARGLVVSLNTVRTHTKHIYTKLGVNNRRCRQQGTPARPPVLLPEPLSVGHLVPADTKITMPLTR